MKFPFIAFPICLLIFLFSCADSSQNNKSKKVENQASIIWQLDSISITPLEKSHMTWTIKNESNEDWAPNDWSLHFNQISGTLVAESIPSFIEINNPSGEYVVMSFNDSMDTLRSKESFTFSHSLNGLVRRMSNTPRGIFIVRDKTIYDISDVTIQGVNHETLSELNPTNSQDRFNDNKGITKLSSNEIQKVFPTPKFQTYQNGNYQITSEFTINANSDQITNEVNLFVNELKQYFNGTVSLDSEKSNLTISLDKNIEKPESYDLAINSTGISLTASDEAGIFYGLKTIINLLDPAQLKSPKNQLSFPFTEIKDTPRFAYRGYMLDVARNYHRKNKVLEVIDLMAQYKLNKFHFHLMDDEGWRLEIRDLPELTSVGSVRGYTPDESDRLRPAYGSGGVAEDSYSTGYYTRQDYIDIVQYANERHIEVIPEIDLPGHARAAIISMRHRYNRLMSEGKEAEALEYVLHDPDDKSVYSSAQNYNDNVINLCQASAYNFIQKVLEETIQLHVEAGVPLKILHTGGDEVPYGAWQGSPICQSFISDMENLSGTDDLHPNMLYFIRSILSKHNIITAGWEEIVLEHTDQGHNSTAINQKLIGEPMLPYVWNAVWGWGREDMVYKLANLGFDVILCNSSSYYFDLAYDSDPREGGLSWSGLTDSKSPFDLEPFDIFEGIEIEKQNQEYFASKEKLNPESQDHLVGIQGELWSETIIQEDLVDYMTFPKLFGLAERAWSDRLDRRQYNESYNAYVNTIGQREMVRLDNYRDSGIQYRIPPPGINMSDGNVQMNTRFPGLIIRYTLDGTEPHSSSPIYDKAFSYREAYSIKAKCFNSKDRHSNTSMFRQ